MNKKEFIMFPLDSYEILNKSLKDIGKEQTLINAEKARDRYIEKEVKTWNDLCYIKDWSKMIDYIKDNY